MKRFKLLYLILSLPILCIAQNKVNGVLEYFPAPGQHINIEQIGTPQAALQMCEAENNMVSLGGFGGYIVLHFEEPCRNEAENPYGIDFTIFGNAIEGSSEAGIVWVMKDENNNGLPDDTWYEIAGSHYYHSKTRRNYKLTYYRDFSSRNVGWQDNEGKTGTLVANSYNQQEYYPLPDYFPDYPTDSVQFQGTLLSAAINDTNPDEIRLTKLDFGYADNYPKKQGVALTIPDNPYTPEVEGAGGDPIDISWAVDETGNYVDLDAIDFVKIVTGYFANLGRLGEASTDVSYVVDVNPDESVSGNDKLLVLFQTSEKLVVGDSLQLEACYFLKGKPEEEEISFETQNSNIIQIDENGKVKALQMGEAIVQASTSSGQNKSAIVQVVEPDSIQIDSDFASVYPGDTILLNVNVFDNLGDKLEIEASFNNLTVETGKIINQNGRYYFVADYPGVATINSIVEGFNVEQTISFQVYSKSDKIQIYFTIKIENENLFPLQRIEVGQANLNSYVENRIMDYSNIERIQLSHALLAGLQKAEVTFTFRDDESSDGKLYLYELEKDGIYSYGWGGKTEPQAFAKTWIASVNNQYQYINNFDKVVITNGDTISLYYVGDITFPWIYTSITANKDSALAGDEIEVILKQFTCSFKDGYVETSAAIPVANQEISVFQEKYYSDESGRAGVSLNFAPPTVISAGNNAMLILANVITSNKFLTTQYPFEIFPNPVEKELHIQGNNLNGATIVIYDGTGRILQKINAHSNHKIVSLQMCNTGLYFVKVSNIEQFEIFKIIKN